MGNALVEPDEDGCCNWEMEGESCAEEYCSAEVSEQRVEESGCRRESRRKRGMELRRVSRMR